LEIDNTLAEAHTILVIAGIWVYQSLTVVQ
jgi:hypothetical protein